MNTNPTGLYPQDQNVPTLPTRMGAKDCPGVRPVWLAGPTTSIWFYDIKEEI